jgi:hypothetical protein
MKLGVDFINLPQESSRWFEVVNTVIEFRASRKAVAILTSWTTIRFLRMIMFHIVN